MGTIHKTLAKCTPLKAAYYKLRAGVRSAVYDVSPQLLAQLRYRAAWGRWPDFADPTTFDEKLLWLNLYWRHPLKVECADKSTLRAYVERQGLGYMLPRIYGMYETVGAIDFAALPERFVLKCTHGCKCNVFCWNKAALDIAAGRRDLAQWMAVDYSRYLGELHYSGMKPHILCEELLDDGTGQLPTDYKVYCFNGRPSWILCYTDRSPNNKGSRTAVDLDWNQVTCYLKEDGGRSFPRPAALPELLSASEKLAAPFPFVRIDFYCIAGRAVLGEMTFTPNGCINSSYTDYAQQEMGRLLNLPQPWIE
ncbi:MAG: ATP-grasp fold amidoligase family protein [Syntrophobacteraceae bacterium]